MEQKKTFITLGSQKFQFNRLLQAIDRLYEDDFLTDLVFAQIGYSDYRPKNYQYKDFLDRDEFAAELEKADIVITHGGTGAIIGAVKKRKKVIAVPRMEKYGEHVDDHQLQIVKQFATMNLICVCEDPDDLKIALDTVNKTDYDSYQSNTQSIIECIEKFIGE